MAILFVALAVGIILLIVLLRSIGKNTRYRIKHGKGMEKFTEIVKVVLLFETIIYIVVFVIVIIKTIAL
ncbi:MAG: hypothetical protein MR492_06000 [Clostridiales bacterium]|nr:hypothetical protein [Clostridiales bacterium]MDD6539831.1 hypothetical protein [Bacillota bacterium]MDD7015535.1 hypothetical protein [Bacillota bacterium]MDY4959859.1 hypothetical protein [Lentihominibacter sp.]